MEERTDLLEQLKQYGSSDMYPFHMPGHKRRTDSSYASGFPNPFSIDITEVEGFDNLHHPEGILKESMEWAASVYGADRTYYLVNGSSSGILSAVCGTTSHGGTILMSRNCHKSAYHGVILNRLKAEYSYPQIIDKFGLQGGLSPETVEALLINNGEIQAVLVVSPTYDGIVSDIRSIAKVVHRFGLPLIVDEAHGAHFSYGAAGEFPVSALELGADVVIQSLHKTLPSFTQTAVMHIRQGYVDMEKIDRYVSIFQSSSPSYIFMAGIERCIRYMEEEGRLKMRVFYLQLMNLRKRLDGMKRLRLLTEDVTGHAGIYDVDRSKIVVSCRGTGWSGQKLSDLMRERYHLEMEMCGADYITAITTLSDTEEGLERLGNALLSIDEEMNDGTAAADGLTKDRYSYGLEAHEICRPEMIMGIADAMEEAHCSVPVVEAEGRVAAEFVYLYPPGIPIAVPGERLTGAVVDLIERDRQLGLPVQGMADKTSERILVVDCKEMR